MKKLYLALFTIVLSLQCISSDQNDFIVGVLKTNDKIIEIWKSNGESLYVVKDVSGNALSEKMTKPELSAVYPELHGLIERGIAGGAGIILAQGNYQVF